MIGSKANRRARRSRWTPCGPSCPVCVPPDTRVAHPDDAIPYREARAAFEEDGEWGDDGWWCSELDGDPSDVPAPPSFPLWERLRRAG